MKTTIAILLFFTATVFGQSPSPTPVPMATINLGSLQIPTANVAPDLAALGYQAMLPNAAGFFVIPNPQTPQAFIKALIATYLAGLVNAPAIQAAQQAAASAITSGTAINVQ